MNKFFKLLILSTLVSFMPITAYAQNQQGCFMVDERGKPLDLSHLCGSSNSNFNRTSAGRFTTKIKRRRNGIPVIDVKFDGKYTFEMMLDTGASLTVLTPEMAHTLKFRADGLLYANTPSSKKVEFPTGILNSASVGGVTNKNIRVAISSALDIGLLGQNFFGQYDITIKEDTIEFRKR